jgi:ribosome biogenesis protein BMS1
MVDGEGGADGEGAEKEEVDSDDERVKAQKLEQDAVKQRNQVEFGGEDGDEETRLRYEGFRQGLYVRVLVRNVPVEFMRNFRPELPVIIGGLLSHEQQSVSMGYISARVKRHRWHKRILKSNDPLIFSVGWRRFQVRSPCFQPSS